MAQIRFVTEGLAFPGRLVCVLADVFVIEDNVGSRCPGAGLEFVAILLEGLYRGVLAITPLTVVRLVLPLS